MGLSVPEKDEKDSVEEVIDDLLYVSISSLFSKPSVPRKRYSSNEDGYE
jgi:hypothetical protein